MAMILFLSFKIKILFMLILIPSIFSLELPEQYDVREHYQCKSFDIIRNQQNCGGCWAFATAEVISDRICISSKGKEQIIISEMELLTCCITLNDDPLEAGCGGGDEYKAFKYWVDEGLSESSCKPFLFANGESPKDHIDKLYCRKYCDKYPLLRKKYFGSFFEIINNNEEDIKREIFYNGPVTAAYIAYKDFNDYWEILASEPGKIYQHGSDDSDPEWHVIKIIGWGEDIIGGTIKKYWLCVNSWGTDEGHDGIFKFIRGINDCGIEAEVTAGYIIDKILYENTKPIIVYEDHFFSFNNLKDDF